MFFLFWTNGSYSDIKAGEWNIKALQGMKESNTP